MNELIKEKVEQLPPYRQELIDDCFDLTEIGTNLVINNFVQNEVREFLGALIKKYPDIETKQIPEYQALVGGGETDKDAHDPEMLRKILEEIEEFVKETKKKKERMQNKL